MRGDGAAEERLSGAFLVGRIPRRVRMLNPDQVIHDRRLARVGRVRDEEAGTTYMRKVGKRVLDEHGMAIVDFLSALVAEPHPEPARARQLQRRVRRGAGRGLSGSDRPQQARRRRSRPSPRPLRRAARGRSGRRADGAAERRRRASSIAVGFVHRDVRGTNVFVRRDGRPAEPDPLRLRPGHEAVLPVRKRRSTSISRRRPRSGSAT